MAWRFIHNGKKVPTFFIWKVGHKSEVIGCVVPEEEADAKEVKCNFCGKRLRKKYIILRRDDGMVCIVGVRCASKVVSEIPVKLTRK